MCGIWGYVGGETIRTDDAWTGLCSLTDRGPDDWGLYISGTGKVTDEDAIPKDDREVVLGNRRLSILDLSTAGNQPMGSDDEGWIVYNGEVYNYQELRADLEERGYEFDSDTDTEVIFQAYCEFGPDCVERFRGMFAFAIYEPATNKLFAARDRFGIKPFYYHYDDGFAFASEVTSLLSAGIADSEIDPRAVDGFLKFGTVPGPRTIVSDVRSLPPGSTAIYDAATDSLSVERYWEPSFAGDEDASPERIRELLAESVDLRLRSDVPVGAFLSGGLDSSTIVALMRQATEADYEDLHTFSIGFEHDDYSETGYAESVADAFGTEHTSHTVGADDIREEIDDIVSAMDQPSIDGVNTYFVSKVAADAGLKVTLSGLGSDELFYGYPSFQNIPRWYRAARVLYRLPAVVRRPVANAVDRVGSVVPGAPTGELADAIRSDSPFGAAYVTQRGLFTSEQRQDLLDATGDDWAASVEHDVAKTLAEDGPEEAVSHAELTWYMRDQLLRDTDTMSMAHSLEVRVPFLDKKLAQYVAGASPASKRDGEKGLLKAAVDDVVPSAVVEREKTGFTFPFADWLDGGLRDIVDRAFEEDRLKRIPLDPAACMEVREGYERGDVHWSRLWALVVLSLWIDEHVVDGESNVTTPRRTETDTTGETKSPPTAETVDE